MHKVIVFPWDDLLRLARGLKAIDRGAGTALAMGNSVSRSLSIFQGSIRSILHLSRLRIVFLWL